MECHEPTNAVRQRSGRSSTEQWPPAASAGKGGPKAGCLGTSDWAWAHFNKAACRETLGWGKAWRLKTLFWDFPTSISMSLFFCLHPKPRITGSPLYFLGLWPMPSRTGHIHFLSFQSTWAVGWEHGLELGFQSCPPCALDEHLKRTTGDDK